MQNKQEQWTVLKRLMSYLKPYGVLTFLALAFLLATTVIKSIIPLVASHFIDQYLSNLNRRPLQLMILLMMRYLLGLMMIASMALTTITSRRSPHRSHSGEVCLVMIVFHHSLLMMHQKVGRLALRKNLHATIPVGHIADVVGGCGG